MRWFARDLEIRYSDTDQMGIVHNGTYPIYCEIGRTDLCARAGIPYHLMEREGYFLMVAELTCRYKAPILYGDQVYVNTAISRLQRRFIAFDYEIRDREQDRLLFTGSSKHIVTGRERSRVSLPDPWFQFFERARDGDEPPDARA